MKTINEIFEKNKAGCPQFFVGNVDGEVWCRLPSMPTMDAEVGLCKLEHCPVVYWKAVFMVEAGIEAGVEERERDQGISNRSPA